MGVLTGYRAIDLTDARGWLAGRILSDMGAEVIRIEKPSPDTLPGAEFFYLNAGKRRITLDIESEAGRDTFRKLAVKTDFLIETSRPGYLASLGMGYEKLSKDNPGLIMVSITDSGQNGPHEEHPDSDLAAQAAGGWLSVTGTPGQSLKLPGNQAWYTAALFAVNGAMLVLRHRHESGRGQHIDISIRECAAATLDHVLVRYACEGVVAGRQGSLHWNNAFRVFPCSGGHVLMTLHREWDTLVEWLDSEGMAEDLTDEKWKDEAVRNGNIGHIIGVLEKWTQSRTTEELVETGQLMRFPWSKIEHIGDLLASPHLNERDFFNDIEHEGKYYRVPGAPVRMSRSPWRSGGRLTEPEDGTVMKL